MKKMKQPDIIILMLSVNHQKTTAFSTYSETQTLVRNCSEKLQAHKINFNVADNF